LLTTAISAATAVAMSASGCTVKSAASDGGTGTSPTDDAGGSDAGSDGYTYDSSTEDGGACLDDTGLAPTCEGAAADCATICAHYTTTYKKGVGRAITDCIVKLPSCVGADTAVAICVQNALASTCPDPTSEGYCSALSSSCGNGDGGDAGAAALPVSECIVLANGLNDTGRSTFTSCINEGVGTTYCKPDPTSCIDTLE
jgi:hypothetical protein